MSLPPYPEELPEELTARIRVAVEATGSDWEEVLAILRDETELKPEDMTEEWAASFSTALTAVIDTTLTFQAEKHQQVAELKVQIAALDAMLGEEGDAP